MEQKKENVGNYFYFFTFDYKSIAQKQVIILSFIFNILSMSLFVFSYGKKLFF